MSRLQEKVALVTGAASGIGKAIARAFATEGATMIVSDIRDDAGRLDADSLGCEYRHLDVREETDWAAAMEAVLAAHRRVDVVVNNAGLTGLEAAGIANDPEHMALEDWRAVFATNAEWTFLGCNEVAAIAVLLASDAATYMTGSELKLDGGLLAGAAAVPKRV